MTTHLTKIWWDLNKHKLVEQAIPEAEIYKREWVGLTQEEKNDLSMEMVKGGKSVNWLASQIEAKLKEKNNG
jgi:hypothetical protein